MGARQGARAIDPLAAREAAIRILDEVRRQPPLRLPLDDALGCVLAEPVTSPLDIPAWTNSAMDGYAARGDDVRGAAAATPRILRVIESIPAGQFPSQALAPGECARIFTGAPLPEGADSVIRQEDTDLGVERVTITRDRDVGVNIRYAGEDIRTGTTVFEPGVELPEGTEVRVETISPPRRQTLAEQLGDLIGSVPDLPPDMAQQHDHYLHGTPKR